MATRRRRFAPVRRASRGPRNRIWVTSLLNFTVNGNDFSVVSLLVGSDWSTTPGFDKATLLGGIVNIHIESNPVASAGRGFIRMVASKVGAGQPVSTPGSLAGYDDIDVMQLWGPMSFDKGVTRPDIQNQINQGQPLSWVLRTKRKLDVSEVIALSVANQSISGSTGDVNVRVTARFLVQTDPRS